MLDDISSHLFAFARGKLKSEYPAPYSDGYLVRDVNEDG